MGGDTGVEPAAAESKNHPVDDGTKRVVSS